MQNQDEAELVAQSLDGNHDAYGILINRYKKAIYYHCFAIVHDEDLAEDVAQETFISGYYKLRSYRPEYKLSTWLFKIATNKALNAHKKAKREIPADATLFDTVASDHVGPAIATEYNELHEAVARLETNHRIVISLHYWQGLSYQEIATVMSSPVGSVRGWLYRAKETLRKELL